MSNKNNFILYQSHKELFKALSDEEAGLLIKAIFDYEETGEVPELSPATQMAFIAVKTSLDSNREKYDKIVERNRENGKLGGRPKNPKNPNGLKETQQNPKEPKKADIDNDNDIDNDIDIENKKKESKKKKESFDDIIENFTQNEQLRDELKNHLAVRKQKKGALTNRAIELELKTLSGLSNDEVEQINIVRQSIEKGWIGFFRLKESNFTTSQKTSNTDQKVQHLRDSLGLKNFNELCEN